MLKRLRNVSAQLCSAVVRMLSTEDLMRDGMPWLDTHRCGDCAAFDDGGTGGEGYCIWAAQRFLDSSPHTGEELARWAQTWRIGADDEACEAFEAYTISDRTVPARLM